MERKQIITDGNDIYVYFELIRQINPANILDVGMFLKRIGAVARQAMNCEVPRQICLEGIDLFPQIKIPIYRGIYNEIYELEAIDARLSTRHYDLAVLLRVNEWLTGEKQGVWEYLVKHSRCILADTDDPEFVQFVLANCRCEALNIEDKQYVAAWCGVER